MLKNEVFLFRVKTFLEGGVDRNDEENVQIAQNSFMKLWTDLGEVMNYATFLKKEKMYKEKRFR